MTLKLFIRVPVNFMAKWVAIDLSDGMVGRIKELAELCKRHGLAVCSAPVSCEWALFEGDTASSSVVDVKTGYFWLGTFTTREQAEALTQVISISELESAIARMTARQEEPDGSPWYSSGLNLFYDDEADPKQLAYEAQDAGQISGLPEVA